MKDQVFMSPMNGQLIIGVPLFRVSADQGFTVSNEQYSIQMFKNKPLAYILDAGKAWQVFAAAWIDKNLISLGDL